MKKFIITEEEKKRIRALYEQPLAGGYKDVHPDDYFNQYLDPQSDGTKTTKQSVVDVERTKRDLQNFTNKKTKPTVVDTQKTTPPVVDTQKTKPTVNQLSKDSLIKIFKDKQYTITPEDNTNFFVGNFRDGRQFSSQVIMDKKNNLIITNTFQKNQNTKPDPNVRLRDTAEYLKFTINLTKSPYLFYTTAKSPETGDYVNVDNKQMEGGELYNWLTNVFKPIMRVPIEYQVF